MRRWGRCTQCTPEDAHTPDSPIPCGRLELRSSPPGRRCRTGQHGRGWERPPSPRAWYGFGARCVCAPAPALLGSLPSHRSFQEGCWTDEAGHAFRAPFPGMGGNPVLDLIAYHDPGLHTVIRVWYYAAPAVAVVLAGSVCLSVWRERRVWSRTSACTGRRARWTRGCSARSCLGSRVVTTRLRWRQCRGRSGCRSRRYRGSSRRRPPGS